MSKLIRISICDFFLDLAVNNIVFGNSNFTNLESIVELYQKGASAEELKSLLGRGRAKKGIYEGDLVEGELEIGQISALLDDIVSVETLMTTFLKEYELATQKKNF